LDSARFQRLIDHAPLFPPASMALEEALAEDRAARESGCGWMLNRFVCPASMLPELPADIPPLSVVLDQELVAPAEAVEVRLSQPRPQSTELLLAAQALRSLSAEVYFELVLGERWRDTVPAAIGAIAAVGGRVKLRCGAEAVPSCEQVALVLLSCARAGVAMKATAGLHRALRHGGHHGFLNLLCAAALVQCRGAGAPELERVLAEEDVGGLPLSDFTEEEWAAVRTRLFTTFGSCSWREPADDLRQLGLIE
jgi:hypothetical protein